MTAVSPPPPMSTPGPARALALPCLLLFGAMLNLTLVVAGLKELVLDELGGTVRDAALFLTVEMVAYILFAPLWGIASDRLGRRRRFVVLGFALTALLYFAYRLVDTPGELLLLRFAQGAAAVAGWSTAMTVVLDHVAAERRGRAMGFVGASLLFGVALGAPIGGYVTRHFGPRAPLEAAGWLFLLLAAAALLLPASARRGHHLPVREVARALTASPRLLLPWGYYLVDRLTVGLFVVVFPLFLDAQGAGDAAARGRYLAVFLLPFALLQVWTGRLAERIGPYRPLVAGSFLYGVALCLVGLADLALLWPVMLLLGVLAAVMFPPTMLLTAQLARPESRASAVAGFNLAGSIGFALGPVVGAWAQQLGGFTPVFLLAGGLEIALALLTFRLVRRWSRS